MTVALLLMPKRLKMEPRIWLILHKTTAGKKTSDNGAVVVLKVVTTMKNKRNCNQLHKLQRKISFFYNYGEKLFYFYTPVAEEKSIRAV